MGVIFVDGGAADDDHGGGLGVGISQGEKLGLSDSAQGQVDEQAALRAQFERRKQVPPRMNMHITLTHSLIHTHTRSFTHPEYTHTHKHVYIHAYTVTHTDM